MAETKIYIPDALDAQLRELAMKRFGYGRGSISKAVETAIAQWIAREDAIKKAIDAVVDEAKNDGNVIAVLLFGSYARKEIGFRDVDIALVVKETKKADILEYRSVIDSTGALYKINVDVAILNSMPVAMQGDILDHAVKLYVRDRGALYDYCAKVVKSYGDARHVRAILAGGSNE